MNLILDIPRVKLADICERRGIAASDKSSLLFMEHYLSQLEQQQHEVKGARH